MDKTKDFINWNNEWSYPLQWIKESEFARWAYQSQLFRIKKALYGEPFKNLYQEELTSNAKRLTKEEQEKMRKNGCLTVKPGKSFILRKAVSNIANQMSGGVDTYEYQINDPFGIIDDDTEDLLAAQCSRDYVENDLESFAPRFSNDLSTAGIAAVVVRYCPKKKKNIVERINPRNAWWDTMYSSTGRERFRGYSRMISFAELAKTIEHEADEVNTELEVPDRSIFNKKGDVDPRIKVGKKKIKTINDMAIYIQDMNKLAASPSIQASLSRYTEYDHDLHTCYNLSWYRSYATDPEARTKKGYNGDDVELTVIYDLSRNIEFKIINRRYIISANKRAFKRNILFSFYNPESEEIKYRVGKFQLDCPMIMRFAEMGGLDDMQYPVSPVMAYLDTFDELCAWRARRDHVSKILSVLRVETDGADATSLAKTFNIMGTILDDIQGDINSINFQYDFTPIDSQIQYLEETIMQGLHAFDQFDALQNMGDRASAAESGMAIGAIAQGLAVHQNAIMGMYSDIARRCIANRVAYSDQMEFPINNNGSYSSVTIQQMALDAIVKVKPALAKKVQEKMMSTNALSLLGTIRDLLTPAGVAYLCEQSLYGNMPRKLAEAFIKPPQASEAEIQASALQGQNQANMLAQNQAMYEQNPVPYEVDNVLQNASPEEIEQTISGINAMTPSEYGGSAANGSPENVDFGAEIQTNPLDMRQQDGAMTANLEAMTPEMGSALANPSGAM